MAPPKSVDERLEALRHPQRDAIDALRKLLLGADERVQESWKWNAPSFALDDHFATFQLRAKAGVQLIMHFGAKKRGTPPDTANLSDPQGLLTWLAPDRATITFQDLADVRAKSKGFTTLVRSWIAASAS